MNHPVFLLVLVSYNFCLILIVSARNFGYSDPVDRGVASIPPTTSASSFSSYTHIEALKNECKCEIFLKSAYLYTSTCYWTPLMLAAREGHLACLAALLGRGAHIDQQTEQGGSAFALAVAHCTVEQRLY